MQSDEEVGKVAQAVPIIISRTLELFVESMLTKTLRITNARNAKTLSPSHMKQCIMSESRFDFLRELVKNIPDINVAEEQQCDIYPERRESSEDGMLSIDSPVNGVVGNPNGGARELNAGSSSSSHWKYTKQHSLDSNAIRNQNNYSTTSNNDNNSPINYSIKIDVNKPTSVKLLRMESTPATIGANNNLASPIITANYLPTTKSTNSDTKQPVITFDFSKIPLLPSTSATAAAVSTSSNHSHSVSNILKLNEKSSSTIDTTKNELQSQLGKMAQRSTSKTQLVKQLSHPYASSTITSNSSTLQSSSAPSTQSSSAHSTTPNSSYIPLSTVGTSSTLEMDEDYDNI
ncbi:dr1-associated corepressor homolog isoform X2 [Contarinia nasturtii]|nr:dr1-associated corepressor homolog isoform X2 [Contarinia nasturtii]